MSLQKAILWAGPFLHFAIAEHFKETLSFPTAYAYIIPLITLFQSTESESLNNFPRG